MFKSVDLACCDRPVKPSIHADCLEIDSPCCLFRSRRLSHQKRPIKDPQITSSENLSDATQVLNNKQVLLDPLRRCSFRSTRVFDVSTLVETFGKIFRNAHNGLRFEDSAGGQVEERKLRFSTTKARHARTRFRRLSIPQDAVTRRVSHRSATPQVVKQTTVSLTEFGGRNLVGKVHVSSAACLRKTLEEGLRTLIIIESEIASTARRHSYKDLRHPVRVRRAARNVYYRQPCFALELFAEKAAAILFKNCNPSESEGFGAVAGIPPQVAQSPIATTKSATSESSRTHSFIGREANLFQFPVPLGALTTVPSKTKISSLILPEMQSRRSCLRLSPSSTPSDGCHRIFMPKSVTRSHALGSSALRKDIVLPEQAPPCNHKRFAIRFLREVR